MFKVIVFTHGRLGEELINTSSLIMGEQEDIESYSLMPGCDLDEMKQTLLCAIRQANAKGQEVLVLTDLMYATPFNIMISLKGQCEFRHLTGTNLALLTEALNARSDKGLDDMCEICQTAQEGIMDADELIRRVGV